MTRSGLSPANSCAMPWSGWPTSASAGSRTSSRKTWNCLSGLTISIGIRCAVSPGASVGTTNSAGRSVPLPLSASLPTTSSASAWSTPLIHTFCAAEHPLVAVPAGHGGDLVGVGAGVGLGDREAPWSIEPSARPGSQRCFCSSVPNRPMTVPQIAGETTIISSGQPAAPSSSQDDRELDHPAAPAAVLLGQVDAEEPGLARLGPQRVGAAAGPGLLQEVGLPVAGAEVGHRRAQRPQLVALVEVQRHALSCSITASTVPASTWAPGTTSRERTTPAAGATTGCCIFIASSTSSGCPARHRVALGHVHGGDRAGHRRDQRALGDRGRGVGEAGQRPQRAPTSRRPRRPPSGLSAPNVRRRCSTPATSRTTSSGVADTRTTSSRPSTSRPPPGVPVADLDASPPRARTPPAANWDGTFRHPLGSPPSTRASRRRAAAPASAAARTASSTSPGPASGAARTSSPMRSKKPVSVRPARNSGCRSVRTSRSRLVVSPCTCAPGQRGGQPARRPRPGSAPRRPPWPASGRTRCRPALPSTTPESSRMPGRSRTSNSARTPGTANRRTVPLGGPPALRPGPRRRAGPRSRRRCGAGRLGRQPLPRGDPQLLGDEVEAGDALGDRVLDLQAGVGLEEPEACRRSVVGEELHGAGADVVDRLRGGHGRGGQLGPQGVVHHRGRRLLDHLLVAALQRALPLAQRPHGAVRVGEHLHLDVPARLDVGLAEHGGVAERRRRLGAGGRDRAGQLGERAHDAHAPPAAARRRLDQHRQVGLGDRGRVELGQHRHAGVGHELLGLDLGAHRGDRGRRRADPGQPGVEHRLRERGVLRQEAVAGVDGVGAGACGRRRSAGRRAGRCRRAPCPGRRTARSASRRCGLSASASE